MKKQKPRSSLCSPTSRWQFWQKHRAKEKVPQIITSWITGVWKKFLSGLIRLEGLSTTRSEQHKVPGRGDGPRRRPDERPLSLLRGQGGRQVVISAATLHDGERRVFVLGGRLQHLEESTSHCVRASPLNDTGRVCRSLWKYGHQCVALPQTFSFHFSHPNNFRLPYFDFIYTRFYWGFKHFHKTECNV